MNAIEQNGQMSVGADVLRGVKPIAAFIGETERRTFYLLERGLIPAGKQGANWVASRRVLTQHYARLAGAGDAP